MLQIEHIYHFLFDRLFYDFPFAHLPNGVPVLVKPEWKDIMVYERKEFNSKDNCIFFYDQEPLIGNLPNEYIDLIQLTWHNLILVSSEISKVQPTPNSLYYFFHGFAALDWFRGYHAINYDKSVIRRYARDYISFNRTITGDRAYRKDFVKKLEINNLLDKGLVSYNVTLDPDTDERLVIDQEKLSGDASASIPVTIERLDMAGSTPDYSAFWHVVTETVFYYDKLHLTEKVFKPIVMKQPFMLLAAPGNLEYLRSYGFKTFEGIIDESYDSIKDNDARIDAVVTQLKWYCDLSDDEKTEIQRKCEPIVEHNFHHFYGKFREIITDELLDNTKKLFDEIGYDDSKVDYATVRKLLTS